MENLKKNKPDWVEHLPQDIEVEVLRTWYIIETVNRFGGNRTIAARSLNITLRGLRGALLRFKAQGYPYPKYIWERVRDTL